PVVVYKQRNFGSVSSPHRKRVTRFPRLEEGNVPINTSWYGMFLGISRVLGVDFRKTSSVADLCSMKGTCLLNSKSVGLIVQKRVYLSIMLLKQCRFIHWELGAGTQGPRKGPDKLDLTGSKSSPLDSTVLREPVDLLDPK
ncbi:hypothetical protein TNCV_1995241, partial [Trichonephila clavipes]